MSDAPTADSAGTLLGASTLRMQILRLVLRYGEVTAVDLTRALGATRNGVGKHLGALTAEGFLIERKATHPRGAGNVIYWSADSARVNRALWELQAYIFGYDLDESSAPIGQSNSRG